MNRTDTAKCYALVCGAYCVEPNEVNIESWLMLLRDLDGALALEATRRLCLRDSPFPPRPGEIMAEARRIRGNEPPNVDAAVGLYFADRDELHPLVQLAAAKCFFDRHKTDYDRARWEFRNAYEAVLYEAEDELRESSRQILGIESAGETHRKALAAATPEPARWAPDPDDDPFGVPEVDPEAAKRSLDKMRARLTARLKALDEDQ